MMMATVCWRSTTRYLQLQRWSSSSTTTPTLLSLRRCSPSTRINSRALSSSVARRAASAADDVLRNSINAKEEDGQQTLVDNHQIDSALQTKQPTIVQPSRASNAHRGVKLTPAAASQNHQQEQASATAASAAATARRATRATQRSFVRIKPVTQTVVTSNDNNNKSTAVASGGGAAATFIESLLRQKNQRRHQKAQQKQQQQQQQEPPHQPYRRHGKNSNKLHTNVNAANSSSLSPKATVPVPTSTSCWVQVDGISPLSSLDAILATVQTALEQQQQQQAIGRITLDLDRDADNEHCSSPWFVERAKVILSPFARPTGWLLKLRNPSLVEALLTHVQNRPLQSGWKMVSIKECKDGEDDNNDKDKDDMELVVVTDATLRIENCSHDTTTYDLMNMFSRFDLAVRGSSLPSSSSSTFCPGVQEWQGTLPNGKPAPPGTFLVHFADASWARAALREKQGMVFKGRHLRLAQYPRQI
jgi:hypothetical protein